MNMKFLGDSMSMMYWRSRADPKKNDDEVSTKKT